MAFWLNGQAATHTSLAERGLTLGDGHFTTMLVCDGEIQLWPLHRQRLQHANLVFGFAMDSADWYQLEQHLSQVASNLKQAVLRLSLTRGQSGRGYHGNWQVKPQWLLALSQYPSHYQQWQQQGIAALLAQQTLASGSALVGLKTLGRAEQVLLKQEADQRRAAELLVCDSDGYLLEATAANLFVQIDGIWQTPQLSRSGIAGVMRQWLLNQLSELGHTVTVRPIHRRELSQVTAAFVCNSLMSIVPLTHIEGIALDSVAHCRPLQEALLCAG
ncbi:aminodeoxychorismate lyase [Ferrimonas senticii]|uniref:aminodeoxychorismate lyase n=1 Tax=Ferrimonas senticii TaxID=394566 RepID=UPI0003F69D2E|nr:aminodeoxychorismate lyase [Ferrimonas senticii]